MKNRIKGFAAGVAIMVYGAAMIWIGKFEYRNSYSLTLYSPAAISTGIVICVLCLVPDSWINRFVRRK